MNSYRPDGLLSCDFTSDYKSYCYLKVIELSFSSVIGFMALFEIYKQFELYGFRLHWKIVALVFIVVSLAMNIFFCLWNSVYQLFSLEAYFNSLYFLTIVADVCNLYIKKNGQNTCFSKYGFYASIIAMTLLYTAILIDAVVAEVKGDQTINCEQIWYLCINVICVALCIVALVVLAKNQKQQKMKISSYKYEEDKVYSPFKALWIWIGINTAAQVIDLVETGLFLSTTPEQHCMIVQGSETYNNIVKFGFALVTLDMGYIATLWYLRKLRGRSEGSDNLINSSNYSEQIRVTYTLEMLESLM